MRAAINQAEDLGDVLQGVAMNFAGYSSIIYCCSQSDCRGHSNARNINTIHDSFLSLMKEVLEGIIMEAMFRLW